MALLAGVGLLISQGCSTVPSDALSVSDILQKETELLDQNVVVVGRAETQTAMSKFNMFKLYRGNETVWVEFPDTAQMPPQAELVRVEGTLKRKKFTAMPEEEFYIEATKVALE